MPLHAPLVTAHAVKAMLADGEELALIDVREELIFSQNHLLWARSVPLSRLELRFARLVPRLATRIVLCDDGDGLAQRAAEVLAARRLHRPLLSRRRRRGLGDGRLRAVLRRQRAEQGVRRAHRARLRHAEHLAPRSSTALIESGADMVVVDSRPFDEYQRVSIPTATNVPGAELVLRIHDIAPSPDTLVVVNCAGRTRSIIGAQSLINAGVPNKVVALRNGTMGFSLAGFACDSGKDKRRADAFRRRPGLGARPRPRASRNATASSASTAQTLERWRADETPHALSVRRARSDRIRSPAMSPARSRRPAASSCRRPTSTPARSARASCWSTTPRCAR